MAALACVEAALTDPVAADQAVDAAEAEAVAAPRRRRPPTRWLALVAGVIALDVFALIAFPPFPHGGQPGDPCAFPACFIESSLEFPAAHNLIPLTDAPAPGADQLVTFYPAISNTILTMWLVMALLLGGALLMTRGMKLLPGRGQNLFEYVYEALGDFGVGIAGVKARPYVPVFIAFFLLVLFDNWIGLVPPVGKVEQLRAPSSDVNITIGMALVSFTFFHVEGFRRLGVRGYLGKFFPFGEFRKGIGAGIIGMFVGLIELMLEFVKPVTLSMRLFGNIYGGEVALGVMTSLTIAFIPVALIGLEVMLNAIQALIFSVLTLIFITLAIEGHHDDEEHVPAEAAGHGEQPAAAAAAA